jgi:outer membrane usher protein
LAHVAFSKARVTARILVRLAVGALLAAVCLALAPQPSIAQSDLQTGLYQKPVSSRLNPTGRTITLSVPVKDEGTDLGEIVVGIDREDKVDLPKAALIAALKRALQPAMQERIAALPDTQGYLGLDDVARAGVVLEFDRSRLELRLKPAVDQRPEGELSLARRTTRNESSAAARPAIFSAYLNVLGSLDHRWGGDRIEDATSARLELQSVFRLFNVVLENEYLHDGIVDSSVCPPGAVCTYRHEDGWKRRRSRLVYDLPQHQIRLQAGDTDVLGTGLQRSSEVLGVAIEKSPRKLQPGESIRPTGRSSFRLDRPSEVDVMVNGAVIQKLRLRPGNYNLTDLPLGSGANDVTLRIVDDGGFERTLAFTTFYDATLLGAGKTEWALSAGVPSYFRDYERQYRDNDYMATAFYRRGITDQITGEVHAQADRHAIMSGVGIFAMTPWALFALQGAASESDDGLGYMASAAVERSNAWGPFSYWSGLKESLRLGAEYRSGGFRRPGEFLETATGIIFPEHPYWLKLHGSYSVPLPYGLSASLSARYQFVTGSDGSNPFWTTRSDRYGIDLTIAAPIAPWATASLAVGYSNERYFWTADPFSEKGDLRVMARLYMRPSAGTSASASYDSLTGDAQVSGRYEHGTGLDRWDTSVDVHQYGRQNTSLASAHASYWGNRFDARLSNTSVVNDADWRGATFGTGTNVTTVRVGTALAFADGAFAVGAPIRGQGFAIVEPHPTLSGKTVTVGTQDHVHARADRLGPGLVSDLPAYTRRTLPIDVDNLPLGYSLGQGAFETSAPFRGGYRIVVGSDYAVTAYGTLLGRDGEPLALLTGTAYQPEKPDKQVAVFTNSAGRFGADGLASGRWVIEMATEGEPTRYMIDVPVGSDALYRAGTLTPVGKGG